MSKFTLSIYNKKADVPRDVVEAIIYDYMYTALTRAEIAEKYNVNAGWVTSFVKAEGYPLRSSKGCERLTSDCDINTPLKKFTCPNCNEQYYKRDRQQYCHICGADLTPLSERCKIKLSKILDFYTENLSNPYGVQYEKLASDTKTLVNMLDSVVGDLITVLSEK